MLQVTRTHPEFRHFPGHISQALGHFLVSVVFEVFLAQKNPFDPLGTGRWQLNPENEYLTECEVGGSIPACGEQKGSSGPRKEGSHPYQVCSGLHNRVLRDFRVFAVPHDLVCLDPHGLVFSARQCEIQSQACVAVASG